MSRILPQELIDIIIQFADDDDQRALSLISHACLRAARPRIWRTLTVSKSAARLTQFDEYMESIPRLTHWVRALRIVGEFLGSKYEWPLDMCEVIDEVVPRLPRLESLCLDNRGSRHGFQDVDVSLLAHCSEFSSVADLSLIGCPVGTLNWLIDVLRGLPKLAHLSLVDVSWSAHWTQSKSADPTTNLRSLKIKRCPTPSPLLQWLSRTRTTSSLHSLSLLGIVRDDWEEVASFITGLKGLRELEIGIQAYNRFDLPSLHSCTELERLHLVAERAQFDPIAPIGLAIYAVLVTLPVSLHLTEIGVTFDPPVRVRPAVFDWGAIDVRLVRPDMFPELRNVRLRGLYCMHRPLCADCIRGQVDVFLPRLVERWLITVEHA